MPEIIELTKEQLEAVTAPIDQPLKVFAGAGTGKTTVLTYRYLHLIKEHKFSTERILALTFTRKAAAELRHRVKDALQNPQAASRAQIWNFDAYWWYLLLENPLKSGIEEGWRIVDETELELFRDDIIRQTFRDQRFLSLFPLSSIERTELSKILNDGYDLIPVLKGRLVDEDSFKELMLGLWQAGVSQFSEDDNQRVREAILVMENLYRCYQEFLTQRKLLDFGDVLIRTFQMLRGNPDVTEYYRSLYQYILVDETQDTNPAQFEILKLLAQPGQINVTVVGDDKQSIYGFRGTSPEKFRRFKGSLKRLRQNRRSPNEILDLATGLICQDSYWEEQRGEIALENPYRSATEQPILFCRCFETREEEAQVVVARVRTLITDGAPPHSIALLFRSKTHMGYFEQELQKYKIPFRSVGGSYYDRPEVKDGLALLKMMIDPEATGPLSRILERPPWSFGVGELQQVLVQKDLNNSETLTQVLEDLKSRIQEVGALSQRISLAELLYQAMVHTGVLAAGCLDPEAGERIRRNCGKLLRLAMEWDETMVEDPVQYFTKLLEHRVIHGADEEEELLDSEGVQLLTIHRAKGLEFDHVFWCDVRNPRQSTRGNVLLDLDLDDIVNGRPVVSGMGLIAKPSATQEEEATRYASYKNRDSQRDDEASRLYYVAVTRAKETLTVTSSNSRGKPPKLFQDIQELLAGNRFVEEEWGISESMEPAPIQRGMVEAGAVDFWMKRLQPIANALRQRIEAVYIPSEPLVLSFADLERYRECPRLLFWSLSGRKAEEDIEDISFLESISSDKSDWDRSSIDFGRVAHKVLMDLPKYPECEHHLEEYLAVEHLADLPGARDRLTNIVCQYHDLGFHRVEDIRTEIPWVLSVEAGNGHHAAIRGVVDRIHRDNQGWVLLDYKTGRIDKHLQDTYFRQMNLYRLAAAANLFPGVSFPKVILVEIEHGNRFDVPVDNYLEDNIERMINAIFAGNYPASESSERCLSCPFRLEGEGGVSPCDITLYEGLRYG